MLQVDSLKTNKSNKSGNMNNTKKVTVTILATGLALWAGLVELRADPILYATAGLGTELIKIDVGTKEVTLIGKFGVFGYGLAISPQGRMFTATDSFTGPPPGACLVCRPQLARVNHSTGHAIPYGSLQHEQFMGIGFSPDGILYGVNADSQTPDAGSLFRFDLSKGTATRVGVIGGCFDIMDLAWDPNGVMYGAAWNSLYRIDPTTGQATLIATITGLAANAVMGLAIDDVGNFYVSEIIPNAPLYKLNPKTGVATKLFDTGLDYIHALVFSPAHRENDQDEGDEQSAVGPF